MLDKAFEALKTYDWGADRALLNPIDEAVLSTSGDKGRRAELESRLATVLGTNVSRDAKDFVCRTLMVAGSAACVPALAALLPDKDNSHMARFALERIPAPEAARALRDSLAQVNGPLKVGVISSLGSRRDADSVALLAALLSDDDAAVASAAAVALGDIRTADAAKALAAAAPKTADTTRAVTDARLACAEALLAAGDKVHALAVYKSLVGDDQPKHIRLAGTRGMLACAGK